MWWQLVVVVTAGVLVAGTSWLAWRDAHQGSGCDMSYMRPMYTRQRQVKTHLRDSPYALYRYFEGDVHFDDEDVKGWPVLFVPGSGGSYKQVRSLGSQLLKDAQSHPGSPPDVFTVDFGEQVSGVFGRVVWQQAEYVNDAIAAIRALYDGKRDFAPPVTIIGHSMGGFVARTSFLVRNHQLDSVSSIVCLSTPQQRPPVLFDPVLSGAYNTVNDYWRRASSTQVAIRPTRPPPQSTTSVVDGEPAAATPPDAAAPALNASAPTVHADDTDTEGMEFEVDPEGDVATADAAVSAQNTADAAEAAAEPAAASPSRSPTPVTPSARNLMTARATRDVALLSIGAGPKDTHVVEAWTRLDDLSPEPAHASLSTTFMPSVLLTMDHLAVLWCRQVVSALSSTLLTIQHECTTVEEDGCSGADRTKRLYGALAPLNQFEVAPPSWLDIGSYGWTFIKVVPLSLSAVEFVVLMLVLARLAVPHVNAPGVPPPPKSSIPKFLYYLQPSQHLPALFAPMYLLHSPIEQTLVMYEAEQRRLRGHTGWRHRRAAPVNVRAALASWLSSTRMGLGVLVAVWLVCFYLGRAEWVPDMVSLGFDTAASTLSVSADALWLVLSFPFRFLRVPTFPSVTVLAAAYCLAIAKLAVVTAVAFPIFTVCGAVRAAVSQRCWACRGGHFLHRLGAIVAFVAVMLVITGACILPSSSPVVAAIKQQPAAAGVLGILGSIAFQVLGFLLWPPAPSHRPSGVQICMLHLISVWLLPCASLIRSLVLVMMGSDGSSVSVVSAFRISLVFLPLLLVLRRRAPPSASHVSATVCACVRWSLEWASLKGVCFLLGLPLLTMTRPTGSASASSYATGGAGTGSGAGAGSGSGGGAGAGSGAGAGAGAGAGSGSSSGALVFVKPRGSAEHASCASCMHEDGGPQALLEMTDPTHYKAISDTVQVGATFRVVACNCPALFESPIDFCGFCSCRCTDCGGGRASWSGVDWEDGVDPSGTGSSSSSSSSSVSGRRLYTGWRRTVGLGALQSVGIWMMSVQPLVFTFAATLGVVYALSAPHVLLYLNPVVAVAAVLMWDL